MEGGGRWHDYSLGVLPDLQNPVCGDGRRAQGNYLFPSACHQVELIAQISDNVSNERKLLAPVTTVGAGMGSKIRITPHDHIICFDNAHGLRGMQGDIQFLFFISSF